MRTLFLFAALALSSAVIAQNGDLAVQMRVEGGASKHIPPAVLWLKPLDPNPKAHTPPHGTYVLTQKNKMFAPHLLIVPVGAMVSFPNADPFFHNVFSLFDGKRFDLGLYETGTRREVRFSREGISYIFCNIHPEMSAVILSLDTPLFTQANAAGHFSLADIPPGEYELHFWVEGEPARVLDRFTRRVTIASGANHFATVELPAVVPVAPHLNEFGQPYTQPASTY